MAPKFTLNYLPVPARGEFIRVIFHHTDTDFEEKTYQFSDIPKIKADRKTFPLGQLPTLKLENGEVISESHAIVRYLAREFDLYGKTNRDKAIIDQILDMLKNVEENLWKSYFWSKGDAQAEGIKKTFEEIAPRAFDLLEKFLQLNNEGKRFAVGDSMTVADIHVMLTIETILLDNNTQYRSFIDSYPLVKALNERVRSSPNIKKYLESRGPPAYSF